MVPQHMRIRGYAPTEFVVVDCAAHGSLAMPWSAAHARSERQTLEAASAAHAAGISWAKIGELLGASAQAAQQRYGAVIGQV
jgi:hypothetical protein